MLWGGFWGSPNLSPPLWKVFSKREGRDPSFCNPGGVYSHFWNCPDFGEMEEKVEELKSLYNQCRVKTQEGAMLVFPDPILLHFQKCDGFLKVYFWE